MNILDLSGKLDEQSIAVYIAIDQAARKLAIPYVVVGASARDLVLHYGYGARVKRATADIDFAIQVPDWETFEALRLKLIEYDFNETKTPHRLIYEEMIIDLVPFGEVQDEKAKIAWPPKGDVVMNVLGFHEAIENATKVIIQDNPKIEIPVVTPSGLSLLKIICWLDRDPDLRNKDAKDFLYLLKSYEEIPEIREGIYEYPDMMESYGWDITLAASWLLGNHAGTIARENTSEFINEFSDNGIDDLNKELLIEEMCEDIEQEYVRNERLLSAWFDGFNEKGYRRI